MMSSKLVPEVRFEEFSGEWEEKKLGEVYTFKVTNSFSRDKLNYNQGLVKNIHYGDIHTKFSILFDIRKEKVPYINLAINLEKIKQEYYCQESDIIFADASEDLNDVGKSIEIFNLNNEKVLSGLHTLLARQKNNNFIKGFGGYLFKSIKIRKAIQREAQGTKVLSISANRLSNIKINFSESKQEQQKIADTFSSLDNLIEAQTKKVELLKSHKKGLMQKLFPRDGAKVPEVRFKEFSGEWEEKKLGELCKTAKSGGTPTSTNQEYYNGDIPFLAISDMTKQGKYLTTTSKMITQEGLDNSASWIVPKDTIIYSMYASVGFVSINKIPLATSQAVINLILKDNINREFIYYFLVYYKQHIHKLIETGTQGNLNAKSVKSIKILIPPTPQEQQKIANTISSLDNLIEAQTKKVELLKEHKKGLMQKMFVGDK